MSKIKKITKKILVIFTLIYSFNLVEVNATKENEKFNNTNTNKNIVKDEKNSNIISIGNTIDKTENQEEQEKINTTNINNNKTIEDKSFLDSMLDNIQQNFTEDDLKYMHRYLLYPTKILHYFYLFYYYLTENDENKKIYDLIEEKDNCEIWKFSSIINERNREKYNKYYKNINEKNLDLSKIKKDILRYILRNLNYFGSSKNQKIKKSDILIFLKN